MNIKLVDARADHAPFVAWAILTAFRSHLEKGLWDFFVDGPNEECLRFLEALAATDSRHWGNYDRFLVAEADSRPVATLCGYFANECDGPATSKGADEAAHKLGWTDDRIAASRQRVMSLAYVQLEREPGSWIVEAVATLPEFRRMGLNDRLLAGVLERGRQRGATTAEVSVLIGNEPAQRSYEKAGFTVVAEARHPEFEALYECPGIRLLRRPV